MSEPKVLTRVDGRVLHVTINRPERMNAIDPETNQLMHEAMDRFSHDDSLWVAVIRGSGGRAFSAGGDLKAMMEASLGGAAYTIPATGYGGLTSRFDLDKPVIAAVNGLAFGGGFEIALASDIVIAADHARFAMPEPKSGIVAYAGGIHRLSRQLPLKQAMELLLTGDPISAATALEWGLINQIVPLDQLDDAVSVMVGRILANAPLAMQATKQCVQRGANLTLAEAIAGQDTQVYPALEKMRASDDIKEGIGAFVGKRRPNWQAR